MWKKWNTRRHVQTTEAIWVFNYVRSLKLFIFIIKRQQIRVDPPVWGGWDRRWQLMTVKSPETYRNVKQNLGLGGSFARPKQWQKHAQLKLELQGVCWTGGVAMDSTSGLGWDKWWALGNTTRNFCFRKTSGDFSTISETVSFSRTSRHKASTCFSCCFSFLTFCDVVFRVLGVTVLVRDCVTEWLSEGLC
jgi:hypothetical protein